LRDNLQTRVTQMLNPFSRDAEEVVVELDADDPCGRGISASEMNE